MRMYYDSEYRRPRRYRKPPLLLFLFALLLVGSLAACAVSPAAKEVAVTTIVECFTPGF